MGIKDQKMTLQRMVKLKHISVSEMKMVKHLMHGRSITCKRDLCYLTCLRVKSVLNCDLQGNVLGNRNPLLLGTLRENV